MRRILIVRLFLSLLHHGYSDPGTYPCSSPIDLARVAQFATLNACLQGEPQRWTARGDEGETLLHWAAIYGSFDFVRNALVRGLPVDATAANLQTPLMWAVYHGNASIVQALLDLGADSAKQDSLGSTAIAIAVQRSKHAVLELLLSSSDPMLAWLPDKTGATPAHWAAFFGSIDSIKILSAHGADFWVHDTSGMLPLHRSCQSGKLSAVRFIVNDHAYYAVMYARVASIFYAALTLAACVSVFRGSSWHDASMRLSVFAPACWYSPILYVLSEAYELALGRGYVTLAKLVPRVKLYFQISRPNILWLLYQPWLTGRVQRCSIYGDACTWRLGHEVAALMLVPSSFCLYGINDLYDLPSDLVNPRKQPSAANGKISVIVDPKKFQKDHKLIELLLYLSNAALLLWCLAIGGTEFWIMAVSLVLVWAYSAPPIRAKTRPPWGIIIQVGYVIPYLLALGRLDLNPVQIIYVFTRWMGCALVHFAHEVYFDKEFDANVGHTTAAVLFGEKGLATSFLGCALVRLVLIYHLEPDKIAREFGVFSLIHGALWFCAWAWWFGEAQRPKIRFTLKLGYVVFFIYGMNKMIVDTLSLPTDLAIAQVGSVTPWCRIIKSRWPIESLYQVRVVRPP